MARKVVVEIELPEGVREEDVKRYLEASIRKLAALAEMERSEEPEWNSEVESLLREIKRRVAERSQ